MQHTLFISDLHLQASAPTIARSFTQFLTEYAPKADAIYILGDLFEYWIGDDDPHPFYAGIAQQLQTLSRQGKPIYFMHGNRDFLLGERFAQAAGITLLEDPTIIELYGKKIVLTHGDFLCTADPQHQSFRKFRQNPRNRRWFLRLPRSWRQKIADTIRNKSKQQTQQKPMEIMDVVPEAVEKLLHATQTDLLIHGHTHRPKIHELTVNQRPAKRIVLDAWHERGNQLIFYRDLSYKLTWF